MTDGGCATFILTLGEVTLWEGTLLASGRFTRDIPDSLYVPWHLQRVLCAGFGGGMGENRLGKFKTNKNLHARDMPPL